MNSATPGASDSMAERRRERFWTQLLGVIGRGNVVPVVGEELLTLSDETGAATLYQALAQRYAELCGIDLPPSLSGKLSATVRNHPDFRVNPHDIYQELAEEFQRWSPPVPATLKALAAVRHFNLFISTTFDDLLERALNEVRFDGRPMTCVLDYSPKNIPDDQAISEKLASGRPVVFQLFGSYKTPFLQYALTDGDMVEFMHALQTAEYRPRRIFAEIYERPLLLLGNGFPDWLARLFLRTARKTPLDHREVPKTYFADTHARSDEFLVYFLRNFTMNTELVDNLSSAEFVKELAVRWQARFADADLTAIAGALPAPAQRPARAMPKNAIFLSYCASDAEGHTAPDRAAACAIRDELNARGIDVWLDTDQLEGGDEYEKRIRRYVNTCSLFMPLISATTESRASGFFRKEWGWAKERLLEFTGSDQQYLFPVVIDDVDPYAAKVPEEFKQVQFTPVRNGRPDDTFLTRVDALYRSVRSPAAGRAP